MNVDAVTTRDISKIYHLLQRIGYTQASIGALTKQPQPEVSAIIYGRRVLSYDVLARIIHGLGIPACLAGLAHCCLCTHRPTTP